MTSFSEREGIVPKRTLLQIDSMDDDLRNSLWNALTASYWIDARDRTYNVQTNSKIQHLFVYIWIDYFKIPADDLTIYFDESMTKIRSHFMTCQWYQVYDFIEFVANHTENVYKQGAF